MSVPQVVTHTQREVIRQVVDINLPAAPSENADAWVVRFSGGQTLSLREGDYFQLLNVLIRAWNTANPERPIVFS